MGQFPSQPKRITSTHQATLHWFKRDSRCVAIQLNDECDALLTQHLKTGKIEFVG